MWSVVAILSSHLHYSISEFHVRAVLISLLDMKKYTVVGFLDEDGEPVEVVPSSWMVADNCCLWPSKVSKRKCQGMIRDGNDAILTWPKHKVKVYGCSSSFSGACAKAECARTMSSLDSDSSTVEEPSSSLLGKRKLQKPARYENSSSTEDEIGATSPPIKKRGLFSNVIQELPLPLPDVEVKGRSVPEDSELENELPSKSGDISCFMKKILHHMVACRLENKEMRKEIKKLREKLDKIAFTESSQVAAALGGIVDPDCDFTNLPLASVEDVNLLEREITKEPEKATSLARFLCRGGSFDSHEILTRYVLKRLLSRDVALQYSLEGKKGKKKFCDLNIFNVVIASVKMKHDEAPICSISKRIGKVLAGSADWDGKRADRVKKNLLVNNLGLSLSQLD